MFRLITREDDLVPENRRHDEGRNSDKFFNAIRLNEREAKREVWEKMKARCLYGMNHAKFYRKKVDC